MALMSGVFLGLGILPPPLPKTATPSNTKSDQGHPVRSADNPDQASAETVCAGDVCPTNASAGMNALHRFYNPATGLWDSTGWWNSANALETTMDYSSLVATNTYRHTIANTFEKNKNSKFLNPWLYDDEGWWALTWIKAYDLTGETRYLDMAKSIFRDMTEGWDSTCGGGMWWHKRRQYKNAIVNELFLVIAARLHQRTSGDRERRTYLDWAKREWAWFKRSGLINRERLINDGLNGQCRNNGQTTWTYNQGVILSGLVDLARSTGDKSLLREAEAIADAAIRKLAPKGILRDACEPNCGEDGAQFKGIFIRNLAYLYQVNRNPRYKTFIVNNARSVWHQNRNTDHQFGLTWTGPFDSADASRQSSAMDAINAALKVNLGG
jgi:predicted alpha-1,6-mannanase (GH76 family)